MGLKLRKYVELWCDCTPWVKSDIYNCHVHLFISVLYILFVCLLNFLSYFLFLYFFLPYTFLLTSLLIYFLTYLLLPE